MELKNTSKNESCHYLELYKMINEKQESKGLSMQYLVQVVGLYRSGIAIILGLCNGLSTKSSFPFTWGASE